MCYETKLLPGHFVKCNEHFSQACALPYFNRNGSLWQGFILHTVCTNVITDWYPT